RAWNMYGAEAFVFERILYCDRPNLLMYEQALIDGLRPEYNIAPVAGSQLGYKHRPDSRERMSIARRRNPSSPRKGMTHTDEAKRKISESRKGKGCGQRSAEWRANIGTSQKGKVISADCREKISKALTGLKQSPETIEKRRQKLIGRKMPEGFAEAARLRMLGSRQSEEH